MADSLALAMVALAEPKLPDASLVTERLKTLWPECPPVAQADTKNDGTQFQVGTAVANYALMPAPIPWKELEGPCQTAWWWREAGPFLKGHKAHLIVAVGDPKGDPIGRCLLLTRLIAALLENLPASAVYWGAAGLVYPTDLFLEQASDITRELLPLNLWIDFRIAKGSEGGLTGFTSGLASLGHMELEVDQAQVEPAHLRDRLYNIAHYVLDHGPVLKDGETIGLSADERIKIHHRKSRFDQRGMVIKLEF